MPPCPRAIGFCVLAVGMLALALGWSSNSMDEGENESAPTLPFGVSVERLGTNADAQPKLTGPSLLLQGDGLPLDTAIQARAQHVVDAPLELVVLAAPT